MELNIKFNEKMLVETANRVLDEFEYKGRTIREWADLIANPKTKADRIRAMTDEELADELLEWFACFMAVEWSREQIIEYLKQEATND